jgi:tetratricopeptide (TPR) repeat protein
MKAIHFLFLAALLAVLPIAGAAPSVAPMDDLVKKGDVLDRKFDAKGALQCYSAAQKSDPKNAALLVRIARQYRHLMSDAGSKQEKLRLGYLALDHARPAAELAPNDPEAQLSVAITYGKLLPLLGSKEQVQATPRVKTAVDKTLRLDPRNDTAWHILGRWHRVLADVNGLKRALAGAIYGDLPKGSNEQAEACFQKAIALNPNRLMHYVELGRVYAQMGRKADAEEFIKKGLSMPNVEKDDPETKDRGREALQHL